MKLVCLSLLAISSLGAFAQAQSNFMTSCRTESVGIVFQVQDPIASIANQKVVEQCSQNSSTNNQECAANVICDDQNSWQSFHCSTVSAGKEFSYNDSNQDFASKIAVAQCQKDSSTNNSECQNNVGCTQSQSGGWGGNPQSYLCESVSHGTLFQSQDTIQSIALNLVIQKCSRDSSTSNAECNNNSDCINPYQNAATLCESVSHGKEFRAQDLSAKIARALVISQCQLDSSTDNAECLNSTSCQSTWRQ